MSILSSQFPGLSSEPHVGRSRYAFSTPVSPRRLFLIIIGSLLFILRLFTLPVEAAEYDEYEDYQRRPVSITIWKGISPWGTNSKDVINYFVINLTQGEAARLHGVEIGLGGNTVLEDVIGIQIAVLGNAAGGDVRGMQLAAVGSVGGGDVGYVQVGGLGSVSGGEMTGLQLSLLGSVSGGDATGFQISGLGAVSGGAATGLQVGGLGAVSNDRMIGLQVAVLGAISGGRVTGVQIGGLASVSGGDVNGAQFSLLACVAGGGGLLQAAGLANIAGKSFWLQVGSINVATEPKGVQLGLINIGEDAGGLQVGLINAAAEHRGISLAPVTRVQGGPNHLDVWGSETGALNVAYRTGTHRINSIAMVAYSPFSDHELWIIGGGIGVHMELMRERGFADLDLIYCKLNQNEFWTEGNHGLSTIRLIGGYRLSTGVTLLAGPTFNYFSSRVDDGDVIAPGSSDASESGGSWTRTWPGFIIGARFF